MSRVVGLFGFTAAMIWMSVLAARGFWHPSLLDTSAKALLLVGNGDWLRAYVGVVYPPIPAYFALLAAIMPAAPPPDALVSAMLAGLILGRWHHRLRLAGYGLTAALILTVLLGLQPLFLWTLSQGSSALLTLLFYYLAAAAAFRMTVELSIQPMLLLALSLAGLCFASAAGVYLVLTLLPFLALLVPRQHLSASSSAWYLILLFPLLAALLGSLFLNWVFLFDPLAFARRLGGALFGYQPRLTELPWLQHFGGDFIRPLLLSIGATLLVLPLLPAILLRAVRRRLLLVPFAGFTLAPLLAVGLGSATGFLDHPATLMAVLVGVSTLALVHWPQPRSTPMLGCALVIGGVLSLPAMGVYAVPEWTDLRHALVRAETPQKLVGDMALGRFLAGREDVVFDPTDADAVIVARATATGLVMPASPEFHSALQFNDLTQDFIALPAPGSEAGAGNALNRRWPKLYRDGRSGYRLVYDHLQWRVYAREKM